MDSECDGLTLYCLYRLTPVCQNAHPEILSILFPNALNLRFFSFKWKPYF